MTNFVLSGIAINVLLAFRFAARNNQWEYVKEYEWIWNTNYEYQCYC